MKPIRTSNCVVDPGAGDVSEQPSSAPGAARAGDDDVPRGDDLLERLLAGDEHALASVVRSWSPSMLRVARQFVSTDASAQEVLQEVWIDVVRGLASFEGRSSLRTWVFRLVVNIAKTRGMREQRAVPFSSLSAADHTWPSADPDWLLDAATASHHNGVDTNPVTAVLRAEIRTEIASAVRQLPSRQRVVLVLRDLHGYGSGEVCDLLGISAANQRTLLHRARSRVRCALTGYHATETRREPKATIR